MHKKRVKDYIQKTNYKATPEMQKEYNKRAYLKRKESLQREQQKSEENI
mgnify:FL=1